MVPQTDLFVRRPNRFAIRVRPDQVVAVGETLVAWEWSTAKDATSISASRYGLNHHALLRERLRRPGWRRYTSVATRVEMLALGYGFTVVLEPELAESWRMGIGEVVEALLEERPSRNQGPHCSTCAWQAPCWFSDAEQLIF